MINQSGKLASLLRCVQRGIPEQGDQDLRTPGMMLDAFPIAEALTPGFTPAAGTVTVAPMTTSGQGGFVRARAAAAASETTRLWDLREGVWRFMCQWTCCFPGPTTAMNLRVNFGGHTITIFDFDTFQPLGGFIFGQTFTVDLAIAKDQWWRADLQIDNTAGPAPLIFSGFWTANKHG